MNEKCEICKGEWRLNYLGHPLCEGHYFAFVEGEAANTTIISDVKTLSAEFEKWLKGEKAREAINVWAEK